MPPCVYVAAGSDLCFAFGAGMLTQCIRCGRSAPLVQQHLCIFAGRWIAGAAFALRGGLYNQALRTTLGLASPPP